MSLPKISIRKGREWQIQRGHPWLFSGAISQTGGGLSAGALVDLVDFNGRFVARGYFNPSCDIAVRVLSTDREQAITPQFFEQRLVNCLSLRQAGIDTKLTDAFRLVNAEGDMLPGYIVDWYAGVAVVQSHTAGGDALLPMFLAALENVMKPQCIVVRNDASVRKREGLSCEPPEVVFGEHNADHVIMENGLKFAVNLLQGQKTGFYTDQRDKRRALSVYCRGTKTLLNCFSYTGAFSIYAIAANPHVITMNVDQSQRALDAAKCNYELNGISTIEHGFVKDDAFSWLEQSAATGERFDIVVLDPPAFAKSHKEKSRALKAYVHLQNLGMKLIAPGGFLVSCSCTAIVSKEEFGSCMRDAAAQSARKVQLLESFENGVDHPVSVAAPETAYLKVMFCRVE